MCTCTGLLFPSSQGSTFLVLHYRKDSSLVNVALPDKAGKILNFDKSKEVS